MSRWPATLNNSAVHNSRTFHASVTKKPWFFVQISRCVLLLTSRSSILFWTATLNKDVSASFQERRSCLDRCKWNLENPIQGWFYLDRTSRGDCHYRHSRGHALAGAEQSKRKGPGWSLPEQLASV